MKQTEIYKGAGCIAGHPEALSLGKRCLIVTGRSSAEKSGALGDVAAVLEKLGIAYTVYNKITENPLLADCREAGKQASEFGADFLIGIGGGSPLDASKAAAVYAAMPEAEEEIIFRTDIELTALPLLAVPLTAGTGSEVNRSAVITIGERKKSFSSPSVLPKAAFLDPRYLKTLNGNYTVSTAIDAFCHCFESYLSPKSTAESETDALEGAKRIWGALISNDFLPDDGDAAGLTEEVRLSMMEGAAFGGRAIMTTGTGFTHPLGYGLTLRYGIPHGRACGAFTGVYIEYNERTEEGAARMARFAEALGTTTEMIAAVIPALSDVNLTLTDSEIQSIAEKVSGAKNYRNSPAVISDQDAVEILSALFGAGMPA